MIRRIATILSTANEWIGRAVSWLIVVMVAVVTFDVAMRYIFHAGSVGLQELEWHLFGALFLLGASYTLKHDRHVRVDILYRSARLSDRQRAWIDIIGTIFLLFPFCILVIWSAWPFVHDSFVIGEHSPDPGGLPYRWLIKATIPVGFVLLFLQGLAELATSIDIIRKPR